MFYMVPMTHRCKHSEIGVRITFRILVRRLAHVYGPKHNEGYAGCNPKVTESEHARPELAHKIVGLVLGSLSLRCSGILSSNKAGCARDMQSLMDLA